MQLNITTDYAVRAVLYLGQTPGKVPASQISQDMSIPSGYLEKILSKLRKESYISADLGKKGGYYLNKRLEEIRLGEIIRVMENTTRINRCLEPDCYCSGGNAKTCKVRKYYVKVQELLEERIYNISLQDILDEKDWLSGNKR